MGLNRTMQYGNRFFPTAVGKGAESLNRTMQYGNLYTASDVVGANAGLNRTMQYGNFLVVVFLFSVYQRFKSYYVVWKL